MQKKVLGIGGAKISKTANPILKWWIGISTPAVLIKVLTSAE